MDDIQFAKENSRRFWEPTKPVSYARLLNWPPQPRALVKWFFGFPGYLLP
jgi:hypothetical protein